MSFTRFWGRVSLHRKTKFIKSLNTLFFIEKYLIERIIIENLNIEFFSIETFFHRTYIHRFNTFW
jgi:hypothetical protein